MHNSTATENDNIPSDETLAKEAQGGDMDAFATLYTRYLPYVTNYVRKRREDAPDAEHEDLVHEIFTRALEMIDTYRDEANFENFRHWLFAKPAKYVMFRDDKQRWSARQTYTNAVADYQRTERVEVVCWVDVPPAVSADVRNTLADMPPHWRQALELHHMDGLPVETVAMVMGCKVMAVKNMLQKSLRALRQECGLDITRIPRRPKGEVRNAILAAARDLFSSRGYDGVGVRDIAGSIGCSTTSVTYYFGSKQALFEAAMGNAPAVAA